jgi:hypothetical protein
MGRSSGAGVTFPQLNINMNPAVYEFDIVLQAGDD